VTRLHTVIVCAVLLTLGCGGDPDPGGAPPASSATEAELPFAMDPPEPLVDLDLPPVEAGRILYEKLECAGCHESAAVPGLVVHPLRGLHGRFNDENLASFLSAPPPPMPDFGLSRPERLALAVYLRQVFP